MARRKRINKARFAVDMHMHSTMSDGALTPTELVERAARSRVEVMALTDHDTTAGLSEARHAAELQGIEFVNGIEISAWSEREVHILGYFIDPENEALKTRLHEFHDGRRQRVLEICDRLRAYEVELDPDDVFSLAERSVGRPHVAKALVNGGHVKTFSEAFDRYIGSGAVAYVPASRISAEEAIGLIHNAGGIASLAHPGVDGLTGRLADFSDMGIDAVEVGHPSHSRSTSRRLTESAATLKLGATGGSDFHHPHGTCELGGYGVTRETLSALESRRPEGNN